MISKISLNKSYVGLIHLSIELKISSMCYDLFLDFVVFAYFSAFTYHTEGSLVMGIEREK